MFCVFLGVCVVCGLCVVCVCSVSRLTRGHCPGRLFIVVFSFKYILFFGVILRISVSDSDFFFVPFLVWDICGFHFDFRFRDCGAEERIY